MDVVVGKVFPEVVAEAKTPGVAQRVVPVVARVADRVAGLDERANKGELMSVSITAPSSAEEGETVSVRAVVHNTLAYPATFKATIYALPDLYPDYVIGSFQKTIMSGEYGWGDASFTMPDCNTTAYVKVERYTYDGWVFYGADSKVVSLTEVPVPEFAGTISKKQLEYDESRASIPVYNIPEGQRGLVHIWGRNDMSTSEKLGIYWVITDPDGMVVEEYEDWEWGTTSPGREHEFIGGRFNLDREKYTMRVELLMNPNNPEVVDRYIGDLCTVAPEIYTGTISRKELEYNETRSIIPVY